MDIKHIQKEADNLFDIMVEARRHIHMYPELSEQEYKTQDYIINFLNKEGISNYKIANTGVLAWIDGAREGKVVALRADIDALPINEESDKEYCSQNKDVMHACGHDVHTSINLGAAKFFNDNKDRFNGTVKFFFQPAEETVGGAKRMILEGCMDNPKVDYVFGLHVSTQYPYNKIAVKYGTMYASTKSVKIKIYGKGGHGAYPHQCVDTVVIASHIIIGLQSIVSRNISPVDSAVITIGKIECDGANNIIAKEVILYGTIRSSSARVSEVLFKNIEEIATQISSALGGHCILEYGDDEYIPLVNNDEIVDVIYDNAVKLLSKDNVIIEKNISMGGEDFAFFNENTPGAFFLIGSRIEEKEDYTLHSSIFDVDERCLKTGLIVQVMNVLHFLDNI